MRFASAQHGKLFGKSKFWQEATVLLRAAARLRDLSGTHRVQQQCGEVSDCVRGEAVQRILTFFIRCGFSPYVRSELKPGRFTVQPEPVPEQWNLYRRWAGRVFMRLLNDRLSRFLLRELNATSRERGLAPVVTLGELAPATRSARNWG